MSPELAAWALLGGIILSLLALDLLVLHRDARPVAFREAAIWSAIWISIALGFGAFVAVSRGGSAGGEYLAGYLIELSLSVDNVFVFALIFAAFSVPAAYQHRLLFWGIIGAVVFRAVFIAAGTAILDAAHWIIYVLGVLLVVTGIRLARSNGHAVEPEKNPVLRLFRRFVPTTDTYRGGAFWVVENGRRIATPLLAVLVTIETTDIAFALDSIPAVFAVTTDPFIVFSSNLFAILGLRSLYFLLAGLIDRFVYLKLGLAALLVFAGLKILVGIVWHVPIALSLGVIVGILALAIVASVVATRRQEAELDSTAAPPPLRGPASPAGEASSATGWPSVSGGVGVPLALRIGSGVLLALAVVGLFGAMAAGGLTAWWLLVDSLVVAAVVVALIVGYLALRRLQPGPAFRRAWTLGSVVVLLLIALLIGLD